MTKLLNGREAFLPEGNRLKENFYAAKSMMKPFGLGYKPRTDRGKTLIAHKKLRYFSITPRL